MYLVVVVEVCYDGILSGQLRLDSRLSGRVDVNWSVVVVKVGDTLTLRHDYGRLTNRTTWYRHRGR